MTGSSEALKGRISSTSPREGEWERVLREERTRTQPISREIIEGDDPNLFITIIPPPTKLTRVLRALRVSGR